MSEENTKKDSVSQQSYNDAQEFMKWMVNLLTLMPPDKQSFDHIEEVITRNLARILDRAFTEGVLGAMKLPAELVSSKGIQDFTDKLMNFLQELKVKNSAETVPTEDLKTNKDNLN